MSQYSREIKTVKKKFHIKLSDDQWYDADTEYYITDEGDLIRYRILSVDKPLLGLKLNQEIEWEVFDHIMVEIGHFIPDPVAYELFIVRNEEKYESAF